MTRLEAEIKLQQLFGFKQFYDLQWQVIENLSAGRRVLFIDKTY
jgi:ATP-dependent DNA helicase RecQ